MFSLMCQERKMSNEFIISSGSNLDLILDLIHADNLNHIADIQVIGSTPWTSVHYLLLVVSILGPKLIYDSQIYGKCVKKKSRRNLYTPAIMHSICLFQKYLSFIAFLNIEASTLRPISRSKWNKLPDYGGQVSEEVSVGGSFSSSFRNY